MRKWPAIAFCASWALLPSLWAQGFTDLQRRTAEGDSISGSSGLVVQRILEVRSDQAGFLAFTAEFGEADYSSRTPQRVGVFKQYDGPPQLLAEPPDEDVLHHLAVNGRGTVAAAGVEGVYIFPRFGPALHVGSGDPAPVQPAGTSFSSFIPETDSFLGQDDEAFFIAVLSNGRTGLFRLSALGAHLVALEGQPVPDRPGAAFGTLIPPYRVRGGAVAFRAGGDVFVDNGSGVRTVLARSEPMTLPDQINSVSAIGVNRAGDVVVYSLTLEDGPELTLFSRGEAVPILGATSGVVGFDSQSLALSISLFLDDSRRVTFGLLDGSHGGIYRWQNGTTTKIVADGDVGPSGGALQVTFNYLCPVCPPLPSIQPRWLSFPRPNPAGEVAFVGLDSTIGFRSFRWEDGRTELIDFLPGAGDDRLLLFLSPLAVEADGSLLTAGELCCGAFSKAVYQTTASPRSSILPYLAGGSSGNLRIDTDIELSNTSDYPVTANFTPVAGAGSLFDPFPGGLALGPRGFASLPSRMGVSLANGFAAVESEGGGLIRSNALIRLRRGGELVSLVNVPASQPHQRTRLLVDQSGQADTGIALSNVGQSPIDLRVKLSDRDGLSAGEATLHLEGGEQDSRFASALFPRAADPDFLGSLSIEPSGAQDKFAVTGLRQSHLLLSALPSPPPPATSGRGFASYLAAGTLQTLAGPDGALAILERPSSEGKFSIRVTGPDGDSLVLNQDTVLPGGDAVSPDPQPGVLVDFNQDMELLFAVRLHGGRAGLYLWKSGELRRLLVSDDEVEGFRVQFPVAASVFSRNHNGMIAIGGLQVVILDPAPRLVVTSDTRARPEDPTLWAYFSEVQLDDNGTVYMRNQSLLGRAVGSRVEVLAQAGRSLLTNPAITPRAFNEIRLTPRDDLLISLSAVQSFSQIGELVRYSQGAFQALLTPNQPIEGLPGFQASHVDRILVNSHGEVLVRANVHDQNGEWGGLVYLKIPTEGQPSLFAAPEETRLPSFPKGDRFSFLGCPRSANWSDDGRLLLHACDRQGRPAAFLIGPNGSSKVAAEGDVFARGPSGPTIQVSQVVGVSGFQPEGAPLVDVQLEDGRGPGEATLASLGTGFQEAFLPLAASGEVNGIRLETRVLLSTNPGDEGSAVVLQPFTQSGDKLPAINVELAPNQVRQVALDVDEDFQGWIRVRSLGGNVSVLERLSLIQGGRSVAEASVEESGLRNRGVIDTRFASATNIGLAIANPWNCPVAVDLTLEGGDPEGNRRQRVVLAPHSQRSEFLADIFPSTKTRGPAAKTESTLGIVRIASEAPVTMIALRQEGIVLSTQIVD